MSLAVIKLILEFDYDVVNEHYIGLKWMRKINRNDLGAILSSSKLDLDTDGIATPGIHFEPTHQDQTTLHGLESLKDPFYVLPGGFADRHDIKLGTLATVFYDDKYVHAIYGDVGPKTKYGEASIKVHESLGFDRVTDSGKIKDIGIDGNVYILIYKDVVVSDPKSNDEINTLGEECLNKIL